MRMINPKELINDELYFADKHYMSVSKFKQFQKCEVQGLSEFGDPTISMLVGSYVDAYVTGDIEKFKAEHPEIISSRGTTKGQLKSEFKKAEEICEYIDNDPIFKQFFQGESQTVMTGEIAGVPFKIKMDNYDKGIAINDLKVLQTVTDNQGNYYDFVSRWGYNYQMAVYQEIVFQNTGERLPTFLCVVTKENPINSVIVEVPQVVLDTSLYELETLVPRFYDIWQKKLEPIGCGKCSACIENRTETPIISWETLQGGSI